MKRILMAAVSAGLLAAAACGSSNKTCDDVQKAINACFTKFGLPTDNTIAASCNAAVCTDKQKAIDCIANAQCGTDVIAYATAVATCQGSNNCK